MKSTISRRLLPAAAPVLVLLLAGNCLAGAIKVFFPFQQGQGAEQFVKEFQKMVKGVTVTPIFMDKGSTNSNDISGPISKKPDVYIGFNQYLQEYADIGIFENLNKYVDKKLIMDVIPSLVEAYTINGRLLGLPLFGSGTRLKYNKEAFAHVGLQVPDQNWTWDKFYEASRRLTRDSNGDGINDSYGVTQMWNGFESLVYSYGGSIVDKNFKKVMYTEKSAMTAANFYLKLEKEKLVEPWDWNGGSFNQDDIKTYPFMNGKTGMTFDSGMNLNTADEAKYYKSSGVTFTPSAAFVPKGPKGRVPMQSTWVISIMNTAKNKKDAKKFVEFMMGYKGQCLLYDLTKGIPTTKSAFQYKPVVKGITTPFLSYFQRGRAQSIRKGYQSLYQMFYGDLMRIASGDATMADLLDNAKTRGSDVLAQSQYVW